MPKTIEHPKQQARNIRIATGGKSQGLRGKIIHALKQSKGGMTVGEIATAMSTPPQHTKALKIRSQIAKLEEELKALNVVEVPKVILPELHDAGTGRIDAQKVADFMGVPLKQLSEGLA